MLYQFHLETNSELFVEAAVKGTDLLERGAASALGYVGKLGEA